MASRPLPWGEHGPGKDQDGVLSYIGFLKRRLINSVSVCRAIFGKHTDRTVWVHSSLTGRPVLILGTLALGQLPAAGGNSAQWPVQPGMAGWVLTGPGPRRGGLSGLLREAACPPTWRCCSGAGGGAWGLTAAASGRPAAAVLGRDRGSPAYGTPSLPPCPRAHSHHPQRRACGAGGGPAPSGSRSHGALGRPHWTHVVPGEVTPQPAGPPSTWQPSTEIPPALPSRGPEALRPLKGAGGQEASPAQAEPAPGALERGERHRPRSGQCGPGGRSPGPRARLPMNSLRSWARVRTSSGPRMMALTTLSRVAT